jgi:hypothetical protein
MKRTDLMVGLTAAAAVLAGCTATSGTARPVPPMKVTNSVSSSSTSTLTSQTTTVGNTTSGLDQTSTEWLSAFCVSLGPVISSGSQLSKLTSSSTAAERHRTVQMYETLGATLTTVAATLEDLPAPTFEGGTALAGKVITAYSTAGPAVTAATKRIAASPPVAGTSGVTALTDSLRDASAPLEDIGSLTMTQPTRADLLTIPSCAAAAKIAG